MNFFDKVKAEVKRVSDRIGDETTRVSDRVSREVSRIQEDTANELRRFRESFLQSSASSQAEASSNVNIAEPAQGDQIGALKQRIQENLPRHEKLLASDILEDLSAEEQREFDNFLTSRGCKLEDLMCPITQTFYVYPVNNEFGNTYELDAIIAWNKGHTIDPLTSQAYHQLWALTPNKDKLNLVNQVVQKLNEIHLRKNQQFEVPVFQSQPG